MSTLRSYVPRALEPIGHRLDQRRPLGSCTSCYSSLPEEPILDETIPWARFCSAGCRNDFKGRFDD